MHSKLHQRLRLESLEDRTTPTASNVQVYLSGGNLYIIGDDFNNSLALWNVTPNAIRIQGNATNINGFPAGPGPGQPQVFALGAGRSVFINLRGGNDSIVLGDNLVNTNSQSLAILGNLRIDLGAGDDFVGLENLFVRGTTTIRANDGDDTVGIDTTLGSPTFIKGNLTVSLGDGTNALTGQNFGVGGNVSITTGTGDDAIHLVNATIAKNLLIAANVGANEIRISDSDVDGNITRISTGADDDVISLNGSDFKRLFVEAGDGDDTVDVGQQSDGVTAVSVEVTTGGDNDNVNITDSDFTLASKVDAGTGNDTVSVSGSNFDGGLTAHGGLGNDTFINGFGNSGINPVNNFENIQNS